MTSSIRKYYRKAKHEMPLCYADKKLYLAELSETLHAIEAEQPDITYEALTEMLGTPAEQTKSYAEMLSAEELYQNIHTMKKVRGVIIAAAVMISFVIGCAGYMISSKLIKSRYTVVIHEPVIVESRAIQE